MESIKMLLMAFAAIFIGAVVSAIPPLPQWFAHVDANQTPWLVTAGGTAVLGFVLMMGGIIDMLMAQDQRLGHSEAEDVERSVRLAARPVAWRATSYRVWGRAAGREGSEEFSLRAMKQAWRSGDWCRMTVWRRRYVIACGALLMTIGGFTLAFTLTPPPVKVLTGGAALYVVFMIGRGLWRT
jgi:hypothetical protein